MSDLLNILDNNVKNTLAGAEGKSLEELQQLLDAERDGKTRKGVVDGLEVMIAEALTEANGEPTLPTVPEEVLNNDRMTATTGPDAIGTLGLSRTEFVRNRGFMYGR